MRVQMHAHATSVRLEIKPRLHVLTLLYNMCWSNNVRLFSRHVR